MSARGGTLSAAMRRVEERRAESTIRRCRSCGRQLFGRGSVCRSRRCPEYGPVWAGDQRQKLFRNLETLPGDILLSAVTAPGAGLLPWDTQQCAALGEHRHSGKLGCRVSRVAAREWNESAADRWRRLHRRAYQDAVKRVGKRSVFLVARVWEIQARGVLHVHPVLASGTRTHQASNRRQALGRRLAHGRGAEAVVIASCTDIRSWRPCIAKDEALRGLALTGPCTGPHALVERVRCKVCAPRPANRPCLGIDSDLGKPLGCHRALENRAAHTVQHVDLAGHAVCEREPQDAMLRDDRVSYVRGKPNHCSGSISCSVAPSRARRQFSLSSAACMSAHASTSRISRRGRSLTSTSSVSIWTFAPCPAARVWKWGGPWYQSTS